ncbi:MAG TPA: methylated-DNA--[protein]-cysteine S-methyltransferase [Methylovirgula sp.]|nr:methylated-DNA--[protein]-cysteine S-methyltransferase [Methylovirgula sp.]
MRLQFDRRASPLGPMLLVFDDEARLRALDFDEYEARMHRLLKRQYGECEIGAATAPHSITRALDEYFAGKLAALAEIAVATGGTEFQRQVWSGLRRIKPGSTTTYGQLAERVGRRGANRAIGLAVGSNPVGIVVPCHRVIGADGTLTGYAGGLKRKQWLLDHERSCA